MDILRDMLNENLTTNDETTWMKGGSTHYRKTMLKDQYSPDMQFYMAFNTHTADPNATVVVIDRPKRNMTNISTMTKAAANVFTGQYPDSSYIFDGYRDIDYVKDITKPRVIHDGTEPTPMGTCLYSSMTLMEKKAANMTESERSNLTFNAFLMNMHDGDSLHCVVQEGDCVIDLSALANILEANGTYDPGATTCVAADYWRLVQPMGRDLNVLSFTNDELENAKDKKLWGGWLHAAGDETVAMRANHMSAFVGIKMKLIQMIQKGSEVRIVLVPSQHSLFHLNGEIGTVLGLLSNSMYKVRVGSEVFKIDLKYIVHRSMRS